MIKFIIGVAFGIIIGISIACLLQAAKKGDNYK